MPDSASLSLLVVDDHPAFRLGLTRVLKEIPVVKSVDHAGNGHEALQLIQRKQYHIVFLDLEMPVMNGLEMLAELNRLSLPQPPRVVVVSHSVHGPKILQVYEMNIHGYLLKNTSLPELNRAILLVADGEEYFSPEVSSHLVRHYRQLRDTGEKGNTMLSRQEKKVLQYICAQLSNPEIAEKMFLAEKTVKRHRYNIKEKIGARNTVGMVLYAVKNGIVEIGGNK
jgi:DNA-binding NarL/FixJ family response regulator